MIETMFLLKAIAGIAAIYLAAFVSNVIGKTRCSERKEAFLKNTALPGLIYAAAGILGATLGGNRCSPEIAAVLCPTLFCGFGSSAVAAAALSAYRALASPSAALEQIAAYLLVCALAMLMKKTIFRDRKVTLMQSLECGVFITVFCILLALLAHREELRGTLDAMKSLSVRIIALNGVSSAAAYFAVYKSDGNRKMLKRLEVQFKAGLGTALAAGLILSMICSATILDAISASDTKSLLFSGIKDIEDDINEKADENLLDVTRAIGREIKTVSNLENIKLGQLLTKYNVSEINVIDKSDRIIATTEPRFIGFDMKSGEQSAAFCKLNHDNKTYEYVQKFTGITFNPSEGRKYAGVKIGWGYVQVGYNSSRFQDEMKSKFENSTRHRRIGSTGGIAIVNCYGNTISDKTDYESTTIYDLIPEGVDESEYGKVLKRKIRNTDVYMMAEDCEGFVVISYLPVKEAEFSRDITFYMILLMELCVFALLFTLVAIEVRYLVTDSIDKANATMSRISGGDLSVRLALNANTEFESLSHYVNEAVDKLEKLIDEANRRMDKELELAKDIQCSALPSVFPPFPDRPEIDVYAFTRPAKNVGGDFYDFFFAGDGLLFFLIADVSGKGIPAALYMMKSKTLIRSIAENGASPEEVFTKANDALAKDEADKMFVTAWMGMLDTSTGTLVYGNAGHTYPIIVGNDKKPRYIKSKPNFVLGGLEGIKYRKEELQLEKGDMLMLYTDGVTEACDKDKNMFGEERLLEKLEKKYADDLKSLTMETVADVDAFSGSEPQFDDITVLTIKYNGASEKDITAQTEKGEGNDS